MKAGPLVMKGMPMGELHRLAVECSERIEFGSREHIASVGEQLAQLVLEIDRRLKGGGLLPPAWMNASKGDCPW